MFDLHAKDGSTRRREYKSPIPADTADEADEPPVDPLDSSEMQSLHRRLLAQYIAELDRQAINRREMAIDEDFYDGLQWTLEEQQELEERGQVPLVFNVIATTIDWVLGTEKRARTDFKLLPRREGDGETAVRKTDLLKYIADVNKTAFDVSEAFEDAAKVGVGWLEDGWQGDDDGEPIYSDYESWRNVIWDSAARKKDLSDARFIARAKWVDLDIAVAMFPDRKDLLDRACGLDIATGLIDAYGDVAMDSHELEAFGEISGSRRSPDLEGANRQRVRIIEFWYRTPVQSQRIKGGVFSGEMFDKYSPGHVAEVDNGEAEVVERTSMRTHVALMTSVGMLHHQISPYRHNRFPFTPIWNKRRGRDGMPYGLIRPARDIQHDVNKRASKALHILSTNKVIMDEGAVADVGVLEDELARPDGIIVKKPGKSLTINADRELSQYHMQMMSRDIEMVQQVGGVTDENLGRSTNAVSGVAIQARQQQGALATSGLFENLRQARQSQGEIQVSLIEQFMTLKKQFRITDTRGRARYVSVNDGLPENDITRTKADFIISEADWRATQRQAQVDALIELLKTLAPVAPQLVMITLDLIVEEMDLPNRDDIVKRVRQMTNMRDPDDEGTEPDAAQAQAQESAAIQAQFNRDMGMAQLKKLIAEAEKAYAQAEDLRNRAIQRRVETQGDAVKTATEVVAAPKVADVADVLLGEAGWNGAAQPTEGAPNPGGDGNPVQPDLQTPVNR